MHFGYNTNLINFPRSCLPNCMYLWGKEWMKYNCFIDNNIIEYKLESDISPLFKKVNCKIKSDSILFIGQPSIQKELLNLYDKASSIFVDVSYRPHPRESIQNIPVNVKISNVIQLHDDLCRHRIVIGGFSTALMEAKIYKCHTLAYDPLIPDGYTDVLSEFNINVVHDESDLFRQVEYLLLEN